MTGITIEHAQIIEWTQSRGGSPALERSEQRPRPIVRFSNEGEAVSWDEWMCTFDHDEWAFIYQDRTPDGELSRSWRIIPRFEPETRWTCDIKQSPSS